MTNGTGPDRRGRTGRRGPRSGACLLATVLAVVAVGGCGADAITSVGTSATTVAPGTTVAASTSPALAAAPQWQQEFLACVRYTESRNEYTAVDPAGPAYGAYQFTQQTWNNTTQHAGLTNLYEIQPNYALPNDQDTVAIALLNWQGTSPWPDGCG